MSVVPRQVTKEGLRLPAHSYCRHYRPTAGMAQPIGTSTSHFGFRLVFRPGLDG